MARKKKRSYSKKELKLIATIVAILLIATVIITLLCWAFPSLRKIAFFDQWMNTVEEILKGEEETPVVIPDGTVAVYYIDVGQGDATLIVAPNGDTLLIDTGEDADAADYLKSMNVTELDYLLLTHYDSDHIGGGDEILELCHVKTVIKPDCVPHNNMGKNLLEEVVAEGSEIIHPEPGYTFDMGDVKFEILTSSTDLPSDSNEKSLCMMMTFGKNKFLFTGDAENEREAEMIENYGKKLDADVYKAGHHGADNASGAELLSLVTPDYAVFSCGEGNKYGHPTPGAIDRIDDYTNVLLRTDTMGTIIFMSDGETITYEIEKGTRPEALLFPALWITPFSYSVHRAA
ncbi:MAG: MBL fold metallo-hydrolase [Clostridia bacterium]|nr:MBL fold metallo-hydrolase [Clostridia bacterium]